MKLLFYFIIFIIFNYIKNSLPQFESSSLEMILFNDKFIYLNAESNSVYITRKNDDNENKIVNSKTIMKNKYILKINDNRFIIFGLTSDNKFGYILFDSNGNDIGGPGIFDIRFDYPISYSIKLVSENDYILSYFYESNNNNCYLYHINLELNKFGGKRRVVTETNYNLNTIECDSFDNENIFCLYSTIYSFRIQSQTFYLYIYYYSFININEDTLSNNKITEYAASSSLLKFEYNNEKKYLICYVEIAENPKIYCQFFIQNGNTILKDKIYYIGQESGGRVLNYLQFSKKSPIMLRKYEYSIYIHISLTNSKKETESLLYVSTIDFNMIIQVLIPSLYTINEKKNILINDYYFVILIYKNSQIEIYINDFAIPCDEEKNYIFEHPSNSDIYISPDIVKSITTTSENYTYVSFSLDPLTNLIVDNNVNIGYLLNMVQIDDINKPTPNINLKYNDKLRITDNYYIYHEDKVGGYYKVLSNFCYFKVINCYDSCKRCNYDIKGSNENHQCSECLNDYIKFIINTAEDKYFNCYKKDEQKVKNYYSQNGIYYKCDNSCDLCYNGYSCIRCKEDYYFKEDKQTRDDTLDDICYKNTPVQYYFSSNEEIHYNGLIINKVYKKCYSTCYTCFGEGDSINNSCIKCKAEYKNYEFNPTKCTIDTKTCPKYWKVNEEKNIECIDECLHYIVHEGLNKNQCVENCQSYINPYSLTSVPLLFYECENQKYCITSSFCNLKNLISNRTSCFSNSICFDMNDYTKIEDIIYDNDLDKAKRSIKLIKYYEYQNKTFSQLSQGFKINQINKYNIDLRYELNEINEKYVERIDFITSSKYKDFTITIYPLELEDYIYANIFEINNLCSVNFTKLFEKINYVNRDNDIIYIALIEHQNQNIPINSINYFFCKFNKIYKRLTLFDKLNDQYSISSETIDITYPLYNYENGNIEDKYSKNLISTIKNLHSKDPNLTFYDINDKIYNDICYPFTSMENTDMTIEDRVREYYIKISLCENNCTIINLFDLDEFHNPRSFCECQVKNDIIVSDNNYSFIYENIEIKKVSNIKALKCANDAFSPKKIVKNYIFWIFIIIFGILLALLITFFLCPKHSIENVLKSKKPKNININIISKFEKNLDSNFDLKKNKSVRIYEDLKSSVRNINDYKKKVYQTSPNDPNLAPPKRKIQANNSNKEYKNSSKEEKKSISRNDYDLTTTTININKKMKFDINKNAEVSFDDIFDDNFNELVNNYYYYDQKKILENNYLRLKRKKEREILKKVRLSLVPLTDEDYDKHINTENEDYLDDYNPYKNQKRNIFLRFKKTMGNPYDSGIENYLNKFRCKTVIVSKKKNYLPKRISKFFIDEESDDFLGDEQIFQLGNNNYSNENNSYKYLKNKKKSRNHNGIIDNDSKNENNKNNSNYVNSKTENNLSLNDNRKNNFLNSFSKNSIISEERKLMNSSINSANKEKEANLQDIKETNEEDNKNQLSNSINITEYYYERNKEIKSFCMNYWNYLNRREFCLYSFYNKEDNVTIPIRIGTFILVITFHFTLNCLLLTAGDIHKRYIYALMHDGLNEGKFVFGIEFGKCFGIGFLLNVIKILFVKLVYELFFRISNKEKEEMTTFSENNLTVEEIEEQNKKINEFIKKYRKKSLIYIGIITGLMILFGYISVCYIWTFSKARVGIILRFIFSFILSIIICAFLCFIISIILFFGKKYSKKYLITCYNYMKIIY